jgi:BirA family transcriptional regulator, biotin operon repressor / biotin---[acetyl-CoA-carboxylase] ligase
LNTIWFDILDSTNSKASELLRTTNLPPDTIIAARFQREGRGQQGNYWESEPGSNLLFSMILYPNNIEPASQFYISMAVSLGIADYLRKLLPEVSVKWPNDIYSGEGKIAGILIENTIAGNNIIHSIAGVGINVNQKIFRSDAPNPVSLATITGIEHDPEVILMAVVGNINNYFNLLLDGKYEELSSLYHSSLYRAGEWHQWRADGKSFSAMIVGIDQFGQLILRKKSGKDKSFRFKEVKYCC